jgi:hypothetical protein
MGIETLTTASTDGHVLADIYLAALSSNLDRQMFPPTPEVQAWLVEKFNRMSKRQYAHLGSPHLISPKQIEKRRTRPTSDPRIRAMEIARQQRLR